MHFCSENRELQQAAAVAYAPVHLIESDLVGQVPDAAPADLNDHGTFEIFSAGKSIGTETFEIHVHSDRIEASGEGRLQV